MVVGDGEISLSFVDVFLIRHNPGFPSSDHLTCLMICIAAVMICVSIADVGTPYRASMDEVRPFTSSLSQIRRSAVDYFLPLGLPRKVSCMERVVQEHLQVNVLHHSSIHLWSLFPAWSCIAHLEFHSC
jgi:hypothetical protein